MDITETTNDLHDWELLQSSSDSDSDAVTRPDSGESFDEIDSGGLIQVNYFSLDSQNRHGEDSNGNNNNNKSSESDNPSWIDPGSDENPTRYLKESGEFWSDTSSDSSDDRKSSEPDLEEMEVRDEGIGEISEEKAEDLRDFCPEKVDESGVHESVNETGNENNNGELKRRSLSWWKMPVEFLKYCLFRISPVWAVSVAAAVMGFVILGRRLHKMKKKARGLGITVVVDDKKVSQVMSRAARLNEAFSIVKRVPTVIQPSLPAAVGSTNIWPLLTLR